MLRLAAWWCAASRSVVVCCVLQRGGVLRLAAWWCAASHSMVVCCVLQRGGVLRLAAWWCAACRSVVVCCVTRRAHARWRRPAAAAAAQPRPASSCTALCMPTLGAEVCFVQLRLVKQHQRLRSIPSSTVAFLYSPTAACSCLPLEPCRRISGTPAGCFSTSALSLGANLSSLLTWTLLKWSEKGCGTTLQVCPDQKYPHENETPFAYLHTDQSMRICALTHMRVHFRAHARPPTRACACARTHTHAHTPCAHTHACSGKLRVSSVSVAPGSPLDAHQVLQLAASVEGATRHPIADGIAAEAQARGLTAEVGVQPRRRKGSS